jgi:carbon-monoxide dehydrogenase medium subunit
MWKEYLFPDTLNSALDILRNSNGRAKIIAGGTDLLVKLKSGEIKVDCLVDITRIPDLNQVYVDTQRVFIGGSATHAQIAGSKLIQINSNILARACQAVGSPQIRNVATIAGNIVSAQPAADAAVALTALDAEISLCGHERAFSIADAYKDLCVSNVDCAHDIIQTISFNKIADSEGASFQRLSKRNALTLPILSVAVFIALDLTDQTVAKTRIVIAPVASSPLRVEKAEHFLTNNKITPATIKETSYIVAECLTFRGSTFRGSAEYRKKMSKVLVERALSEAIKEAMQNKK